MPDFRDYALAVPAPGRMRAETTRPLGALLRDVMRDNSRNFRLFGPDETKSNRLDAVYEVSKKTWLADILPEDADGSELSPDGRVMEMLSEHTLEGWLEGYLLTGRHGLLSTYEAFAHVIDSMFNQHAKWLAIAEELPWRAPVSSLNLLITSTVWRQDHNGFTHQDPGFLDVVDLYRMTPATEHPHGLGDRDFDSLFTVDKPIIFNFHGYPWLIHRLAYRRTNHRNLHVRGYKEKGNINTPLELAIENEVDRFSLAIDVIDRVPRLQVVGAHVKEKLRELQLDCRHHAFEHGIDAPEHRDWRWPG